MAPSQTNLPVFRAPDRAHRYETTPAQRLSLLRSLLVHIKNDLNPFKYNDPLVPTEGEYGIWRALEERSRELAAEEIAGEDYLSPLTPASYEKQYQVRSELELAAYMGFTDVRDLRLWFTSPAFLTALVEFMKLGAPSPKHFGDAARIGDTMFEDSNHGSLPNDFREAQQMWDFTWPFKFQDGAERARRSVARNSEDWDAYLHRYAYLLEWLVKSSGWVKKDDEVKRQEAVEARCRFLKDTDLSTPNIEATRIKEEPQWTCSGERGEVYAEAWNRAHNALRFFFLMISKTTLPDTGPADPRAKFAAKWNAFWRDAELLKSISVQDSDRPEWMRTSTDTASAEASNSNVNKKTAIIRDAWNSYMADQRSLHGQPDWK